MQQIANGTISDLINEFNLKQSDVGICFYAVIYSQTKDGLTEIVSEVQIVTVRDINSIYLLNPHLKAHCFPSLFESSNCEFSYKQNYGLIVRGTDPYYGRYALLIKPVKKNCFAPTLTEIRAKTYN